MINFDAEGVSVSYLNHQDLINNAYDNKDVQCNYIIKSELFEFAKEKKEENEEGYPKRKRQKTEQPIELRNNLIEKLKKITEYATRQLKRQNFFCETSTHKDTSFLKNTMEKDHHFPKLNGQNNYNSSQVALINGNKYLIPAHCQFYNYNIKDFESIVDTLGKCDLIILDPPWRNKFIRRIKKANKALGYSMLHDEDLVQIPIKDIVHKDTLVIIWCTNAESHHTAIKDIFLPAWNLKLLAKWWWIKLNKSGEPICNFNESGRKQPYETLFVAAHYQNMDDNKFKELKKERVLLSIPSIIHSHKPPLFELFQQHLPRSPKCVEIFARYLHPNFTSVGLEVLKLMNLDLYRVKCT